jgi:transcriptional regulator with GAF, ATPase, and Fis domain
LTPSEVAVGNKDEAATEGRIPISTPALALSLLVMSRDGVVVAPLPARGEVTIGRSPDCSVRIDDAKSSRVHAVLRIGDRVEVVDRGSLNGTLVGDKRLKADEPVVIELGAMITIGTTVLVLQSMAPHAKPKRVWSQAAFEARLEEEEGVARGEGSTFALVRLKVPEMDRPGVESTSNATELAADAQMAERLEALLNESLRPADVVAVLARGLVEILLPRTTSETAAAIATQLRTRLKDAAVAADVGVATYPQDGRSHASLETRAQAHIDEDEEPPKSVQFDDDAMARLAPLVTRVASSTINLLILGETGVGKEVMARSIHEQSPRASAPLVTLNCAALSESLLESELFGHEKGAFTGALQAKPGLLETAQGGTVFLDEIGEMPLSLQAKLLRVIEQREVQRVGSLKPRPIDVRFIAATNRDLEEEVREKRFREDLFFRLNGMSFTIPPLRERVGSIEPLARAFVAQASALAHREPPAIASPVLTLLKRYRWPGNIRELRNIMERATLLCSGPTITLEHVPSEKMGSVRPQKPASERTLPGATLAPEPSEPATRISASALQAILKREQEEQAERQRIVEALAQCAGNQTKAAELLGISRRTLVSRLSEYGLPRPRK